MFRFKPTPQIDQMDQIIKKYGEEYILRQLAEECAELNQAALKMIRAQRGETPVLPLEARGNFIEELADVHVMLRAAKRLLSPTEEMKLITLRREKENRMYERMLGITTGECRVGCEANEK